MAEYTPYHSPWKNFPDTSTPLVAAAFDYMEAGIANSAQKPAGLVSGEAMVWNGTTFARSSVTKLDLGSLAAGGATTGQAMVWNGSAWAPGNVSPTMGTALPGSPVDGQEFILVDNTSNPTYQWRLRYVAAKSSNKWIVIGGSDVWASVTTAESRTSATYGDLTTVGPTFTTPVAGDWLVFSEAIAASNGGWTSGVSVSVAGVGAQDLDGSVQQPGGPDLTLSSSFKASALAASSVIKQQYRGDGTHAATFKQRYLRITPLALGG